MITITESRDWELSRQQVWSLISLLQTVWPDEDKTVSQLVDHFIAATNRHRSPYRTGVSDAVRFIAWDGEIAIGQTETFARQVKTAIGEIRLMAGGRLVVAPESRRSGRGLSIKSSVAARLIRQVFTRVDRGEFPVCLFQTNVPNLFMKFGAKSVENSFVNTRNQRDPAACPWSDEHVGIYPSAYAWPDGPIDLNGEDF